MRVPVKSTWRTRVLLLIAFIAAGLIAYSQTQVRLDERAAEREAAADDRAQRESVVEIEIEE